MPTTKLSLPTFLPPMLAQSARPFDSPRHLFEVKWDGIRALVFRDQDRYRIVSRRGHTITEKFPELECLAELACGTVLDGELVVLRGGNPDLSLVQARQQTGAAQKIKILSHSAPVSYIVFDQLFHRHRSLLHEPLWRRRELLRETLAGAGAERIVLSEGVIGVGCRCAFRLELASAPRTRNPSAN